MAPLRISRKLHSFLNYLFFHETLTKRTKKKNLKKVELNEYLFVIKYVSRFQNFKFSQIFGMVARFRFPVHSLNLQYSLPLNHY